MKKEEFNLEETQKFIDGSDPSTTIKIIDPENSSRQAAFSGLSKDEILKYGSDPLWVKIRWFIFIAFWAAWFGMLAFAILVVVYTPKCPFRPKQEWWDREVIYQLDVKSFKDSNGDGTGDLNGLIQKLDYFDKLGAKVICLRDNLIDPADAGLVQTGLGDEASLKALKKALDEKDMHLIIDIPAASLSSKDEEIITKWLTNYADGIRITQLDSWDAQGDERVKKLNKWIELGSQIAEKTFRPKMVTLHPYSRENKDSPRPNLVVDRNLLTIKDTDLKEYSKFKAKTNFTDANSYILSDYSSKRVRDSLMTTRFLWTYHGLVLLLKGTPVVLFGEELEYTQKDKFMKWDNSQPACGFSNSSSAKTECSNSVKKALAVGLDSSLLKLYEKLIKLRVSEPSFKWGEIRMNDADGVNVISYVREADRFDGFLVIGNLDDKEHSADFKHRHDLPQEATVEFYHAGDGNESNDFSRPRAKVEVDNVRVKSGDFLVLRFSREPPAQDSESSQSVGGHG